MSSTGMKKTFKVAIIQQPPVFLNLALSMDRACKYIEEAASQGAKIIVFPETWLPGYPIWLDVSPNIALWDYTPAKLLYKILVENSLLISKFNPHFRRLLATAKENDVYIVLGINEVLGGTLYNTILYLHRDGATFRFHRKLIPTYTERMVWGRGDGSTLTTIETEFGTLGGLVCWEHWMPLARAAMHAKNEIIHVSQWPAVKELHHIASRHYAFEGQCFVLAAGCYIEREDIIAGFNSLPSPDKQALEILTAIHASKKSAPLKGGSAIIGPDCEYIVSPVYDRSCILYADLDPGKITQGHLALDTNGHYSRPDIFHLEVNDKPQMGVHFKSQDNEKG